MPDSMTDFNDMRRYSNALRLVSERNVADLTQQLLDGDITLAQWQTRMKTELRQANKQQFITGHGGSSKGITAGEYGRLGPELRRQYQYLRKFAAAIEKAAADGKPLIFVTARAQLYAKSTQAMFWKAAIPVALPQVPRDGKTDCKTNCSCRLDVKYVRDEEGKLLKVRVFWRLGIADHCESCKRLTREWNPLEIEVGAAQESDMRQAVDLMLREAALWPVREELYRMWGVKTSASV